MEIIIEMVTRKAQIQQKLFHICDMYASDDNAFSFSF